MKYPEIRDSDTRSTCQSYTPLYPVSAIIPQNMSNAEQTQPQVISANSKLKIFSQKLTRINFYKVYIYTYRHICTYSTIYIHIWRDIINQLCRKMLKKIFMAHLGFELTTSATPPSTALSRHLYRLRYRDNPKKDCSNSADIGIG